MTATEPVLADSAPEADEIVVGTAGVTADDVLAVARRDAQVRLAPAALDAMAASRSVVDDLAAAPTPAYGIYRLRGARHPAHQPGPACKAAAEPHPLARRRRGPAGRA